MEGWLEDVWAVGWGVVRARRGFEMDFSAFLHVDGRKPIVSRLGDSSMAMIHRESYSIRGELWVDKEDSL